MEIDRGREVRWVAEATRFAFDAHDLAVEAFGHAVGDWVLDEPEHAGEMTPQRGRDLLHRLEPGADCPAIPAGEEPGHCGLLSVRPERAQSFFDRPGPTDLQIQCLERGERFRMPLGSALIAEQPEVLRAGQRRVLALPKKRPMLLLPDCVDRL